MVNALFFVVAIFAVMLLIQGAITMMAAWIVTGQRPELGDVIKAIILSVVAYVITLVLFVYQFGQLSTLGLPLPLLILGVLFLPLLISCWVFARCLDINLLQAFATNLLTTALFVAISYFSTPYLPADSLRPLEKLRKDKATQFTVAPHSHSATASRV